MSCRFVLLAGLAAAALVGPGASAAQPAEEESIPLLEMDGVPLTTAIRQLAARAHLNLVLDPRLAEPRFEGVTVSFSWHDVTAREALIALLDNHGLVMVNVARSPRRFPGRDGRAKDGAK